MKKLICALLIVTMLLGSVSAFAAKGYCDSCGYYGTYAYSKVPDWDGCECETTTNYYCADCGAYQYSDVTTTYHHDWHDEIIDGREAQICYGCDAVRYL